MHSHEGEGTQNYCTRVGGSDACFVLTKVQALNNEQVEELIYERVIKSMFLFDVERDILLHFSELRDRPVGSIDIGYLKCM